MAFGNRPQAVHPFLARPGVRGAQLEHIAGRTADGERARVLVAGAHHRVGEMRLAARRLADGMRHAAVIRFAQIVAERAGRRVDGEPAILPA